MLSHAIHDADVLNELRAILRASLNGALNLCSVKVAQLQMLDADEVMVALRDQFDPAKADAPIQDCFTDAFHTALRTCNDVGEALTAHKQLPSGVRL